MRLQLRLIINQNITDLLTRRYRKGHTVLDIMDFTLSSYTLFLSAFNSQTSSIVIINETHQLFNHFNCIIDSGQTNKTFS